MKDAKPIALEDSPLQAYQRHPVFATQYMKNTTLHRVQRCDACTSTWVINVGETCLAREIAAVGKNNGQRDRTVRIGFGVSRYSKEETTVLRIRKSICFKYALASIAVER